MATIYDRAYKVPAWVVIDLPAKKVEAVIEALVEEHGCHEQYWPANSFVDTVKELGRNGWPHIVNQAKPFVVDISFLGVAVSRHLKNFFGENTILPGSPERPWQHVLNRKVEADADYARIFNDVLRNERPVVLSQVFDVGKPKSKVYVTGPQCDRDLVAKLSDRMITVADSDATLNVKGKKVEEIVAAIVQELENFV